MHLVLPPEVFPTTITPNLTYIVYYSYKTLLTKLILGYNLFSIHLSIT